MLRNVLMIVWCRFGSWSLVIKSTATFLAVQDSSIGDLVTFLYALHLVHPLWILWIVPQAKSIFCTSFHLNFISYSYYVLYLYLHSILTFMNIFYIVHMLIFAFINIFYITCAHPLVHTLNTLNCTPGQRATKGSRRYIFLQQFNSIFVFSQYQIDFVIHTKWLQHSLKHLIRSIKG